MFYSFDFQNFFSLNNVLYVKINPQNPIFLFSYCLLNLKYITRWSPFLVTAELTFCTSCSLEGRVAALQL